MVDVTISSAAAAPYLDVRLYGADPTGVADSTAAIQAAITASLAAGNGTVTFPPGVFLISGALQDTGRSNAQLLLPSVKAYSTGKQITVRLLGSTPPPAIPSVVGSMVLPDTGTIIKSSLGSGTGSVIGGWGPVGSYGDFTNIHVVLENLTVRLPANPTNSGVDLSHVAACELNNVVIDTGSYDVDALAMQTTATSWGLRTPASSNGAFTRLDNVNVIGFYNGLDVSEHVVGDNVAMWGCKRAYTFEGGAHASFFGRIGAYHCASGLVFLGTHYTQIDQFNIEHSDSGTWVPVYDVDDSSSYGHGNINWHVVLAGVGVNNTFGVNGAGGLVMRRLGSALFPFTSTVLRTPNLLGWWRVGEKSGTLASDVMGVSAGTYVGSPTLGVRGLLAGDADTAVSFNGTSQRIDLATGIIIAGGDWSLCALINPNAVQPSDGVIFGAQHGGVSLRLNTGNVLVVGCLGISGANSSNGIGAGSHYICATYEQSTHSIQYYIDGCPDIQTTFNPAWVGTANQIAIGAYDSSLGGWYEGVIDEPMIFGRTLTAAEIAAIYSAVSA